MTNPGPISDNRDLLADLKQDTRNADLSKDVPDATREHIAGATGKLATAIAQHQGADDLSKGSQHIQQQIPASGGPVDKQAIQESLDARAEKKAPADPMNEMERGSAASRLQSAAEQYRMAGEGKQAKEQQNRS